ncbi:MAG: PEP-CTERM sorting domain-containing protein [Armatimonadota bacterium]|jgi:hypothetical protein
MRFTRIITALAAIALLAGAAGTASAWQYGDAWIITTYELVKPEKWVREGNGGPGPGGGAVYHWTAGFDGEARVRWRFDSSVHHGDAPTTAELFRVWTWVPKNDANPFNAYNPIEVSFDGIVDEEGSMNPNIPWAGQFGTNHQWLNRNLANQGDWVLAGTGPQAPAPGLVYAKAGSYFFAKSNFGFYGPNDRYPASAIMIQVVPEPGSLLAMGAGLASLGGLLLRHRS